MLRGQLRVGVQEIHVFEVSGLDANRVAGQLDALHREGEPDHQYGPAYDKTFAHRPTPNTWFNHPASVLAGWLEELGVGVEGPMLFDSWHVVETTTE